MHRTRKIPRDRGVRRRTEVSENPTFIAKETLRLCEETQAAEEAEEVQGQTEIDED